MDFLLEIGLEEVPARMIAAASAELRDRVAALLTRERLAASGVDATGYSTPRRLAVLLAGVAARQQDSAEELIGPALKIAYKDGMPGPAAIAFARKAGVPVDALKTVSTPKGDYIAATSTKAGRSAGEVLTAELPKEIAAIYWAKNMYWRAGKPERFVRPVRWLVCLLGDEVVPIEFGGYTAGRITFGHRVLFGSSAIPLQAPEEYAQALTEAHVRVDVEVRRHTIRKALDRVCRTRPETRWREDHALVDKMTHMTEWPTVLAGGFDPEFLSLPEEVLVTVMRDHQNYFAVEDQTGRLAPHFLAVLNTEASLEGEAVIRHGNERVLRARFNDARFFWEFDQRTPLRDRLTLLEHVTFQKDLGSYAAKSHRNRILCERLAETSGAALDFEALVVAATLAKADLTAELVKEFTELQGIIGGLYARVQGMGEVVAAAIYDQYRPAAMDDRIPRTVEGQILAIADKADTIAGMFGLGMEPTGSKDPFALRRAANGVVKILAESDLKLGLGDIARAAANGNEPVVKRLEIFFAERLEFYLREARGQAYDVVKAVLAVGANDVRDAVARAEAVTGARGSADFDAVSAAFKRMQNVLAQAREKGIAVGSAIDSTLFRHPAEAALVTKVTQQEASVRAMRLGSDYAGALRITASLRPEVDTFFDAVMVMDPDAAVRANRLAVLSYAVGCFGGIADFSEIVVAG